MNPHQQYMPQLDGIRTIAVGLVLVQHLGGVFLSPGYRGVQLFFVLSRFLISGILLRTRDLITNKQSTKPRELGLFYVRRTARIFRLYYFTIIVFAILLNVENGRDYWGSVLSYGMNVKISCWLVVVLLLLATVLLSVITANSIRSKPAEVEWEYKLASWEDRQFDTNLAMMGSLRWELSFARRALSRRRIFSARYL